MFLLNFSLCLPSGSKPGKLTVGVTKEININLLKVTPLITNPNRTEEIGGNGPSLEYFIDVQAIKIEGKDIGVQKSLLSIDSDGYGGTKIIQLLTSPDCTLQYLE